jgi:hypothetical protein
MIERMTVAEAKLLMDTPRNKLADFRIGQRYCDSTLRNQYIKKGNFFSYCQIVDGEQSIQVKTVHLI